MKKITLTILMLVWAACIPHTKTSQKLTADLKKPPTSRLDRLKKIKAGIIESGCPADKSEELMLYINMASKKFDLDYNLIISVIKVESNFNFKAESGKGAQGLMQLMPKTAEYVKTDLGMEGDIYSPRLNIILGSYYLKKMITRFDNPRYALLGYNQGPYKTQYQLVNNIVSQNSYPDKVTRIHKRL